MIIAQVCVGLVTIEGCAKNVHFYFEKKDIYQALTHSHTGLQMPNFCFSATVLLRLTYPDIPHAST